MFFFSIFVWLILERFARVRLTGDTTISRALGAVAERNDDNARNQVDEKLYQSSQKLRAANEAMLEMFKNADSQSDLLKKLEARKEFFENWKTTDYRFLIFALAQIEIEKIENQIKEIQPTEATP